MNPSGSTPPPVRPPWRRIGPGSSRRTPAGLGAGDECYYAFEYRVRLRGVPPGGRRSLLLDFKIPTAPGRERAGSAEGQAGGGCSPAGLAARDWRKKDEACRAFALDLAAALPRGASVCHVPSSRVPGDPRHDPRFARLFDCLGACRPDLRLERPFSLAGSRLPAHEGGPRSWRGFRNLLRWEGLRHRSGSIALVDDVITTGSHFRACRDLLREHGVESVIGFFWALAVADDPA